jgi:predicted ABC-type ATPase
VTTRPQVIVIAGPNGAGKSTAAAHLLPEGMTYVNADEVAKGLPRYPSREADIHAGRIVLNQMDELEQAGLDFAVETTLASRSLAARIARLRASGYWFRLIYIWLPSADLAVQRVAERVRRGGHHIPEETIRRRYEGGLRNFFSLYMPMADRWALYENTVPERHPTTIAEGRMGEKVRIAEPRLWQLVLQGSPMDDRGRGILGNWDATSDEIAKAIGHAIREAVRDHRRAGNPIAVWDWDKNEVKIIPPEEIAIPDEVDVLDEAVETWEGRAN